MFLTFHNALSSRGELRSVRITQLGTPNLFSASRALSDPILGEDHVCLRELGIGAAVRR